MDEIAKMILEEDEIDDIVHGTILEVVKITPEKELKELFDKDIPAYFKEMSNDIGAECTLYHKKDDVPGYEYVANCVLGDRHVALGFDVDVEFDDISATVWLLSVYKETDAQWTPGLLVFYHKV